VGCSHITPPPCGEGWSHVEPRRETDAAASWTICSSGSRPVRQEPGSLGAGGTETVCDPPFPHVSGAVGRVDHGMMTGGVLARS